MAPMRLLSPAEISQRLGVSVRALRLYERKGLIRPQRSAAGWRAYGPADLSRLLQILALKSLGLSLAQIADLIESRDASLENVLAMQEAALMERRAEADRALQSIKLARAKLASGQSLSLDEFTTLTRETMMTNRISEEEWRTQFEPIYRKHLSADQYSKLFPGESAKSDDDSLQAAWEQVFADACRLMDRDDTHSPEARDVLRRWFELAGASCKGDADLLSAATVAVYEMLSLPSLAEKLPVDYALMTFMAKLAIKGAAQVLERPETALDWAQPRSSAQPRVPEPIVRRLIKAARTGEIDRDLVTPGIAELARQQAPVIGPIMEWLGELKAIRFFKPLGPADVFHVEFAEGVLVCTIALDADGKVAMADFSPDAGAAPAASAN